LSTLPQRGVLRLSHNLLNSWSELWATRTEFSISG